MANKYFSRNFFKMLVGSFSMEFATEKLELASGFDSIPLLEDLLCRIREEYSIAEDQFNRIWIVLNEAVTNAIRHGNKCDPAKKVRLMLETRHSRHFCFTVEDEGAGFDPQKVPDPTSPKHIAEPNGRGIYLIRRLANSVNFSEKGTRLEISFDLSETLSGIELQPEK